MPFIKDIKKLIGEKQEKYGNNISLMLQEVESDLMDRFDLSPTEARHITNSFKPIILNENQRISRTHRREDYSLVGWN